MAELAQTAANVLKVDGAWHPEIGRAGATITAGMPVYKDSSDNDDYKPSRANAVATALCDGIAMCSASDGQPLIVQKLTGSLITLGATLAVGETYVVSDATQGKIMPLADLGSGDYPVVLGVAKTAANFQLGIQAVGVAKP